MAKCLQNYKFFGNLSLGKQRISVGSLSHRTSCRNIVTNFTRSPACPPLLFPSGSLYNPTFINRYLSQFEKPQYKHEELDEEKTGIHPGENQATRKISRSSTVLSNLYIPRSQRAKVYPVLTPHLDFDLKLENLTSLRENLRLRGTMVDITYLEVLKSTYLRFKSALSEVQNLEHKEFIIKRFSKGLKISDEDGIIDSVDISTASRADIQTVKRGLKSQLKTLKSDLDVLDIQIMAELLALPNELSDGRRTVEEFFRKPELSESSLPHWKLTDASTGNDLMSIQSIGGDEVFFMCNSMAQLDTDLGFCITDHLDERGFLQHSNPDFVRGALAEACCMLNHRQLNELRTEALYPVGQPLVSCGGAKISSSGDELVVTSHPSRTIGDEGKDNVTPLMLAGGASVASYVGYYTNSTITNTSKFLPQKLYCVGKLYSEPLGGEYRGGVFTSMQSTSVSCFLMDTKENVAFEQQGVTELLELLRNIYGIVGVHYRIKTVEPSDLKQYEKLAYSVQMLTTTKLGKQVSNPKQSPLYVEVGRVSVCGDFLSRRLYMTYERQERSEGQKKHDFLQCIFCEVMNVSKVLAAVAENVQDASGDCDIQSVLQSVARSELDRKLANTPK